MHLQNSIINQINRIISKNTGGHIYDTLQKIINVERYSRYGDDYQR